MIITTITIMIFLTFMHSFAASLEFGYMCIKLSLSAIYVIGFIFLDVMFLV